MDNPFSPDTLGRIVRRAWIDYCRDTQEHPKPSHIVPFDQLPDWDKEVDRRIGLAVTQHVLTHFYTLIVSAPRATLKKVLEGVWK